MRHAKGLASRLWKDEGGAALLEYSILIGLITAAVITVILNVGTDIKTRWDTLFTTLSTNKQG
jgi:pilus assembly protein Flp/PilA